MNFEPNKGFWVKFGTKDELITRIWTYRALIFLDPFACLHNSTTIPFHRIYMCSVSHKHYQSAFPELFPTNLPVLYIVLHHIKIHASTPFLTLHSRSVVNFCVVFIIAHTFCSVLVVVVVVILFFYFFFFNKIFPS